MIHCHSPQNGRAIRRSPSITNAFKADEMGDMYDMVFTHSSRCYSVIVDSGVIFHAMHLLIITIFIFRIQKSGTTF